MSKKSNSCNASVDYLPVRNSIRCHKGDVNALKLFAARPLKVVCFHGASLKANNELLLKFPKLVAPLDVSRLPSRFENYAEQLFDLGRGDNFSRIQIRSARNYSLFQWLQQTTLIIISSAVHSSATTSPRTEMTSRSVGVWQSASS